MGRWISANGRASVGAGERRATDESPLPVGLGAVGQAAGGGGSSVDVAGRGDRDVSEGRAQLRRVGLC